MLRACEVWVADSDWEPDVPRTLADDATEAVSVPRDPRGVCDAVGRPAVSDTDPTPLTLFRDRLNDAFGACSWDTDASRLCVVEAVEASVAGRVPL